MPKNYIKQMREQGHDDATIKDHMVLHGWQAHHIDEIFISMGHAADADVIQPPNSEVMVRPVEEKPAPLQAKPAQVQALHPQPATQAIPHVMYEANPLHNVKSGLIMIQQNPILIAIWAISVVGAVGVGIITFQILLYVLSQYAAIALFGLGVGSIIDVLVFLLLILVTIWVTLGVYWTTVRAIQIRALLLAAQRQQITMHSLFTGMGAAILRSIGGMTILAAKMLAAYLIPVLIGFLLLESSSIYLQIGSLIGVIATGIVYVRNSFLPYVLVSESSIPLFHGGKRAYDILRGPQDKSLEVLGWLGFSALIGALLIAASNLLDANGAALLLTGIQYTAAIIALLIPVSLLLLIDSGYARLYAGAISLERTGEKIRRANAVNAILFVVGIIAYFVMSST